LSFSNNNILGAPVGGGRLLYSKNEWQTTYLKDVNSLFLDPGLTGTGQQLGLSTTSPYFGIYGHQYDNAKVGGGTPPPSIGNPPPDIGNPPPGAGTPPPGVGVPQETTPNPPGNFRVIPQ